ncbi:hypothetical protein Tco_0247354 [Tanacetum coccineum]
MAAEPRSMVQMIQTLSFMVADKRNLYEQPENFLLREEELLAFLSSPGIKLWEAVKLIFRISCRGELFHAIKNAKVIAFVYNKSVCAAKRSVQRTMVVERFLQELFKQQRYATLYNQRDAIKDGMFELNKVHMDDNASDMLTNAVTREKLKICCSFAGMANSSL